MYSTPFIISFRINKARGGGEVLALSGSIQPEIINLDFFIQLLLAFLIG